MLEINGSTGEGGGQILRTAIALSAIKNIPVRVFNIRKNRPKPGLFAQHETAIRAVSDLCNAEVEGLFKGSEEVIFRPGRISGGYHNLDIGTAGSITLVLQAALPVALNAEKNTALELTGGTDVKFAPPFDFFRFVLKPLLERSGAVIEIKNFSRGYYPKGGGKVSIDIKPAKNGISGFNLKEQGFFKQIKGNLHSANLPGGIASRLKKTAELELLSRFRGVPVNINTEIISRSPSTGIGLTLAAVFENTVIGSSALGEKGIPAEKLAKDATAALFCEISSGATADKYLADQMLIYISEYGGGLCVKKPISNHVITNMDIIKMFSGDILKLTDMGERIQIAKI